MGLVAPRHVRSSQTRARTRVPCIGRRIFNHCATREALKSIIVESYVRITRKKVNFVEGYSYHVTDTAVTELQRYDRLQMILSLLKVREKSWLSCSHLCHYKDISVLLSHKDLLHILEFHKQIHIT